MLVNGAAGVPSCCSRTGRDAPQIDPRRKDLKTICLMVALMFGCKHPAHFPAAHAWVGFSGFDSEGRVEVKSRSCLTSGTDQPPPEAVTHPRLQSVDSDTALKSCASPTAVGGRTKQRARRLGVGVGEQ